MARCLHAREGRMRTESMRAASPEITYPPAPWALAGQMYCSLWWVPAERCRAVRDRELVPIEVAGRVCVTVGFVDYQQGSVLTYGELFVGMMVRHAGTGRSGSKVDLIWVDDATSQRGGRELWGIPKELGRFELDHGAPGGGFSGRAWDDEGRLLIEARFGSGLGLPLRRRTRLSFPGLQRRSGLVHSVDAEIECSPRLCRATHRIPADSPLAALGIAGTRPLMSLWAKDFRTRLPAAVPLPRRETLHDD
ncbi:MAG: acetoacetate decarboxylase family protein [Minicystis sp.]